MSLERKKQNLKRKIERQKNKTLIRESKLKRKIEDKKQLSSLEQELEDAKHIEIPEEDMKLLDDVKKDEEKSFKHQLLKVLSSLGSWLGKALGDWVKRSRAEKEAYRKSLEKKDD